MFSATKFNTGRTNPFTHKIPEGTPFKKLKELEIGKTYVLRSAYINTKGNYGDEPVAVTDGAVVNLPAHQLSTIKTMIADSEAIEAINAGLVGFKPYEYDGKNGHGYSVEWVDVAPVDTPFFNQ